MQAELALRHVEEAVAPKAELLCGAFRREAGQPLYDDGIMTSRDRLLARILRGTSDANIPFGQFCTLLRGLGFDERINGSHHIFTMSGIPEILNLQPKGAKAKVYQVRQVRNIILEHRLAGDSDD